MKTNILKTMAVALVGLSLAACSDVDIQSIPYSEKVTDLAYTHLNRHRLSEQGTLF